MTDSRLVYRARQFWRTLYGPKKELTVEALRTYLSPPQIVLFRRMQPVDQAHAILVLDRLRASGQTEPDLLAAALLHDVGKIIIPLSIWERVIIVVGKRLFPRAVHRWGQKTPRGLCRPFVVAERHPEWGADLAAQTGASARTVILIGRHQQRLDAPPRSRTDRLLFALQSADDEN